MYTFENDPEGDQFDVAAAHELMLDELIDLMFDYIESHKGNSIPNRVDFKYGYLSPYTPGGIQGIIDYLESQARSLLPPIK